jgi:hypothetical protein
MLSVLLLSNRVRVMDRNVEVKARSYHRHVDISNCNQVK